MPPITTPKIDATVHTSRNARQRSPLVGPGPAGPGRRLDAHHDGDDDQVADRASTPGTKAAWNSWTMFPSTMMA